MSTRSISLVVLLALAAGCGRRSAESAGTDLNIAANTQDEFRELRIGVANIREGEFTDAAGAKSKGLLALMRVYVREKPAENLSLNVHQGQKVLVSGYSVTVAEIRKEPAGVRVSIDAPKP